MNKITIITIVLPIALAVSYLITTGIVALILLLWGITFSPVDVNVWGLGGIVSLVLILLKQLSK